MSPKYILFHAPGATNEVFFDENSRDNCCEPYIALRRRLADLGYVLELTQDQDLAQCERIVFWDVDSIGPAAQGRSRHLIGRRSTSPIPTRDVYAEALARGMEDRLVLMLCEPVSVRPSNSNVWAYSRFRRVLTWNAALADGERYLRMYLPVTAVYPDVPNVEFARRKMLVDISGNKASSHPRELYAERRSTISFFDRQYPNDFDLYGVGWNTQPTTRVWRRVLHRSQPAVSFGTYRGTVRHKWEVLPKYKFNICYENIRDEPDYVSQRIFDVLRCGCVPVYLGAPNIEQYVDKDAFVDRRAFGSNEDLASYMASISESEYRRFLEAGRDYLSSEKFKLFLSPNFVTTMLDALGLAGA